MMATVTKTVIGELGHGALSLLADRPLCDHVASAVVGFFPQQASLETGVLATAGRRATPYRYSLV